jgi:hypothetical protein
VDTETSSVSENVGVMLPPLNRAHAAGAVIFVTGGVFGLTKVKLLQEDRLPAFHSASFDLTL